MAQKHMNRLVRRHPPKEDEMERRPGITTMQMLAAPPGAAFVWVNSATSYPRRLAHYLGRNDLRIVSPMQVSHGALRGLRLSALVVDHAAKLTPRQRYEIEAAKAYLLPSNAAVKPRSEAESA